MLSDNRIVNDQRLEFLHWRFTAFYIVRNAHIVGYCEGIIAYRLIFFVLSHKMLHQISTMINTALFDEIGIGRAYLDIQKNDAKNFTALLISSSDG